MDTMEVDVVVSSEKKPKFPPLNANEISDGHVQYRRVRIPPHRMTPLHKAWKDEIFPLITNIMKIDVCVNRKKMRMVELKTTNETPGIDNLNKCASFIEAFGYGFDVEDAKAILRRDEVRVERFEIEDVKRLQGEHLSRAIGRLSGKGGKTKFAIQNATETRIVIADKKIYVMGTCTSLKVAKGALSSLILGSPTAKLKLGFLSLPQIVNVDEIGAIGLHSSPN